MEVKGEITKYSQVYRNDMIRFLVDMIKLRSFSGKEGKMASRVKKEMKKLEFDEVFVDKIGNVIGRIGNGKKILAIDAHIDVVDIGDRKLWNIDPFKGIIIDDVLYGRGAAAQKGGIASMIYAGKIIKTLGIGKDYTIYFIGSVMKEECEGLAWKYIINENKIKPDFVIITEPTNLNIFTGSRGRAEIEIIIKGLSCNASVPERGINAIYKSVPIIKDIDNLNKSYKEDNTLGKASAAVTQVLLKTPSEGSIPDECTIKIDRRITCGENVNGVISEIKSLKGVKECEVKIEKCTKSCYTGYTYQTNKVSLPWLVEEENTFLKLACKNYENIFNKKPKLGKWNLNTNGSTTNGIFNIPTIGFGPGNEMFAHGPREKIWLEQLVEACKFYAMFPKTLKEI